MQKEGPIVTFSHVVKKIRLERFTWKKNSCKSSQRKKKFVQAENSPPPPPITFLMVRPLLKTSFGVFLDPFQNWIIKEVIKEKKLYGRFH